MTLSTLQQKLQKFSVYSLASISVKLINLLSYKVYTVFLTPTQIGILGLMKLVKSGTQPLFSLGTRGAALNFYYKYDDVERERFYVTLQITLFLIVLVFLLLFELYGDRISLLLFGRDLYDPYIRLAISVSAVVVLLNTIAQQQFRAKNDASKYALLSSGKRLLQQVLGLVGIVLFSAGVVGYLVGHLVGAVVTGVVATVFVFRNYRIAFDYDKLKATLSYSLPMFPHLYSGFLIDMADRALLTQILSLEVTGIYTVGYGLGAALTGLIKAANNTVISEYAQAQEDDEVKSKLPTTATQFLLICGFLSVGFALFAPFLLEVVFGGEYTRAVVIIPWLALAFFVYGIYHVPIGVLMHVAQRTKYLIVITVTAAIVNILFNLWAIPRFGMVGAAMSTFVAYAVLTIQTYLLAQRFEPIAWEYRRVLIIIIATVVPVSGSFFIKYDDLFLAALFASALFLLFPILLTVFDFWSEDERVALHSVLF